MTTTDTQTAEQHRANAAAAEKARQESWDRSDTDGFLSQWAHGLTSAKERLAADIAENGGKARFPALFDLEGNLVPAKEIKTKFGWSWALLDPKNPRGRFLGFFNESKASKDDKRIANDRKKGYTVGAVMAPAHAELAGSNAISVHPVAVRDDGGWSADVEILHTVTYHDFESGLRN